MCNQGAGSLSNSFSEFKWSFDQTFTWFVFKILDSCRDVSKESNGVSNNIKRAKNFIKLFDYSIFVMIDKFLIDSC